MVGVEPGVIEGRARPSGNYLVARLAGGRKPSGHMIGTIRLLILGFVTRVAIGRDCRVVVVHVTTGARDFGVSSNQRKNCVVVVERRRLPG